MTLTVLEVMLGALSGTLVGFSLALVGGGGSILAVPLMVYLVGVRDPHVAIGTSALAVAANAGIGLAHHARAGHVRWPCGLVFAAAGIAGAYGGSTLGKAYDGQKLLFLFALVMILVGALMLRGRPTAPNHNARLDSTNAPPLVGLGFLVGLFAGFFGIGGGFLIVPSLIAAINITMISAVGTSLIAVTAFGLTTAFNYALSGLVDWPLAAVFIAGGLAGSLAGTRMAKHLSATGRLAQVFAALIFAIAAYMLWRQWTAL